MARSTDRLSSFLSPHSRRRLKSTRAAQLGQGTTRIIRDRSTAERTGTTTRRFFFSVSSFGKTKTHISNLLPFFPPRTTSSDERKFPSSVWFSRREELSMPFGGTRRAKGGANNWKRKEKEAREKGRSQNGIKEDLSRGNMQRGSTERVKGVKRGEGWFLRRKFHFTMLFLLHWTGRRRRRRSRSRRRRRSRRKNQTEGGTAFPTRGYFLAFLETTLTERITGKNCFALIPREFDVERKRARERERIESKTERRESAESTTLPCLPTPFSLALSHSPPPTPSIEAPL